MAAPQERELDGVSLDNFLPGMTRDVSPILGAWLVAQGYAEPEMRLTPREPGSGDKFNEPAAEALSALIRSTD